MATMSDEGAAAPRDRVLVVIEEERNRELLADWLRGSGVEVVAPTPGSAAVSAALDETLGLYVTDVGGLREAGAAFEEYRRRIRPRYVPCLLIVPDDGRDPRAVESEYGSVVDDVIPVPVRKAELRRRVETLLRAHRFSTELDQQKEQYRRLVELMPEAIFLLDGDEVLYANGAGIELLTGDGLTDAAMSGFTGERFPSFVAEEDRQTVATVLESIAEGIQPRDFVEATVVPENGDPVQTEVTGVQVPYEGDVATQLVVRDVSERERRKERLHLFGRAIDEAAVGIAIVDATRPGNPAIYANEGFETMTGYDATEVLGRGWEFLRGEDTDPETAAAIDDAMAEGQPLQARVRNYRKDGTPFWNEVELLPVEDDDGAVTHILGFHWDVTDREERKRKLEQYETIFGAAGEAIYSLDEAGYFTNVNEALETTTGHAASTLLGEHASMVMSDPEIERCESAIRGLLRSGEDAETVEIAIETATGERRTCLVTIAVLPHQGDFRGTVGVLRDVTEIRQREQQLAVMDRVLRHDIRNTMNVIGGRAEILEAEYPETAEHVREIRSAANSLLALSEDARKVHDTFFTDDYRVRTLDLAARVRSVVDYHRDRYPETEVRTEIPGSAMVVANEAIDHAIEELVENAIVHNDADDPSVEVTLTREGREWVVEVTDDGPGVPEEEQASLDESVESALDHSSGLGLWLVAWIVDASSGTLHCEPAEPRGTRMQLRLRAAEE